MSEVEVEHSEKRPKKFDKVKGVIRRNWKPITIGVSVIIVVGVTIYVTKRRGSGETAPIDKIVQNMNNFFGVQFWKQNLTMVNYTGTRGHPGFMTYWIEGKQVFPSMTEAAEIAGCPINTVSQQMRGLRPDACGQHFVRVLAH